MRSAPDYVWCPNCGAQIPEGTTCYRCGFELPPDPVNQPRTSAPIDARKRPSTLGDLFSGGRGSGAATPTRGGPTPTRGGPTPSRSGPTPARGGPTSGRSGPRSPARSGPTSGRSGSIPAARTGPAPAQGGKTPMRAGSTSGGRGRRWGTRAAPRDDIDYGGAPSYSTGSGALPATKSPPYPVRRDEPRARGPDDVALFDAGSYLEEDDAGSNGARVGYGDAPQGYYPPFAPGGQMRGARRSRAEASLRFTLNSLVIGLVIFILGVPIAVGLSRVGIVLPSAGPQAPSHLVPTPPVATGYTGFENTVFSLAYPSNWLRSPAGGTFHGGAAVDVENFWDGGQKALVVITTNAVASDQVQSYFAEVLSKTGAVSPHQTGSGLALSYDGVTWNGNEYAATLTRNGQNLAVKARLLTATTGGTTYFIVIIAPQAAFDRAEKQTFEPILQSFRFQ